MNSSFVVPAGWTITNWETSLANEALSKGVQKGPLDIMQPNSNVNCFSLQWLNQSGEACCVSGLNQEGEKNLHGQNLTVNFGGTPVQCDLTVTLAADLNNLTCSINPAQTQEKTIWSVLPVTGGGTFTATANAGPPFPWDTGDAYKR